jgi:hypothetical protein
MVHKGYLVKHLSLLLPSEQDKYSSFTFTLARVHNFAKLTYMFF